MFSPDLARLSERIIDIMTNARRQGFDLKEGTLEEEIVNEAGITSYKIYEQRLARERQASQPTDESSGNTP